MKTKKVLSALFVCALLVSVLGITAFAGASAAITTGTYDELVKGISVASNSNTIQLTSDIDAEGTIEIPADKTITLDLNGHTVSMSVAATTTSALITNNGTLTIKDSAANGKLTYVSSTVSSSYSTSTIINKGTLTVKSGIIENTSSGGASYAIDNCNTLTVEDGKIVATYTTAIRQVQTGANDTSVKISGGTIEGGYAGLQVHVMSNAKSNTTEITGGTFKGVYAFYTYFYNVVDSSKTEIEVSDGVFNGYVYLCNDNKGSYDLKNVSITGGKFNGAAYIFTTAEDGSYVPVKAITGGTFIYDQTANVVDGYKVVDNDDGTCGVQKAVAEVNGAKYAKLADAITAAQNDDIITVLADIDLTEGVTVPAGKSITLDLNGKTISGTHGTEYSMIHVLNGAELTVKDTTEAKNGKITYTAGGDNTGAAVWVEGKLTLESGTIEATGSWTLGFAVDLRPNAWGTAHTVGASFVMNNGTVESTDTAVRVASTSSDAYDELGVTFTMNGGSIKSNWDAIFVQHLYNSDLNVEVASGKVSGVNSAMRIYGDEGSDINMTVTGGEFVGVIKVADAYKNADPIAIFGGTFSSDVSAYVADGYEAVDNGNGTYGVQEAEVKDVTIVKLSDTKYAFVSTVGSLDYSAVGFDITIGGKTNRFITDTVYDSVVVSGNEEKTINGDPYVYAKVVDFSSITDFDIDTVTVKAIKVELN